MGVPVRHASGVEHRRLLANEINRLEQLVNGDFALNVSRGLIPGMSVLHKFGKTDNVDNGVATDIHDGANIGATGTRIWVAPTAARTHQIASLNANDTSAGTGCRTLRLYGLTDWDTKEVSEDITMNGTTNVATANQYVIIYRMKALTWGSAGPNVGEINATADTDATVTATITAGMGQTEMAIYGVPSTQVLYMTHCYATVFRSIAAGVDVSLLVNTIPDQLTTAYINKGSIAAQTTGSTDAEHPIEPPRAFAGPCIIKVEAVSDANNTVVSAGFNGYLVDNPE